MHPHNHVFLLFMYYYFDLIISTQHLNIFSMQQSVNVYTLYELANQVKSILAPLLFPGCFEFFIADYISMPQRIVNSGLFSQISLKGDLFLLQERPIMQQTHGGIASYRSLSFHMQPTGGYSIKLFIEKIIDKYQVHPSSGSPSCLDSIDLSFIDSIKLHETQNVSTQNVIMQDIDKFYSKFLAEFQDKVDEKKLKKIITFIYQNSISPIKKVSTHRDRQDQEYCSIVAIYPYAGHINHSCDPNIQFIKHSYQNVYAREKIFTIETIKSISSGDELFITFLDADEMNLSTIDRRAILLNRYGFHCMCTRCLTQ